MSNRPVILFTTFWDADRLAKEKYFLHKKDEKTFYRVILSNGSTVNFNVYGISLGIPKAPKIPNISSCGVTPERLCHFCPTYDMFSDYKKDHDWEKYTNRFKGHLKNNRAKIIQWVESLENKIYILCCWENTQEGLERCHRKIVYDALSTSASLKDKALFLYRHGTESRTPPNTVTGITHIIQMGSGNPELIQQPQNDQEVDGITYLDEIDSSQYHPYGTLHFQPTIVSISSVPLPAPTSLTFSQGMSLSTVATFSVESDNDNNSSF